MARPPWTGRRNLSVSLCWDGAVLLASYTGTAPIGSIANIVPPVEMAGGAAGFGTLGLSGVVSVKFLGFALTDAELVAACIDCPEHCCKGPVPNMVLSVSGVPAPPPTIPPTDLCSVDWSPLNGTTPLVRSCLGGAGCSWGATIDSTQKCKTGGPSDITTDFTILIGMTVGRNLLGQRLVTLSIFGVDFYGAPVTYLTCTAETEAACVDVAALALSCIPPIPGVAVEVSAA